MKMRQEFFVGIQDAGKNNEMTNRAVLEVFSDVTNFHGLSVNQGTGNLETSHIAWFILNWKLRVLKRAVTCDTVRAYTWAQSYTRASAVRDYRLESSDGEVIALASSIWCAVNTETGRLIRLNGDIMDGYGVEPESINFADLKYENIRELPAPVLKETDIKIMKCMTDANYHVHNTVYLDLVNELMPDGADANDYNCVEVGYRKEIKPDGTVHIAMTEKDGKLYYIITDSEDGTMHASVILSKEQE